jgi:hypothetical protein
MLGVLITKIAGVLFLGYQNPIGAGTVCFLGGAGE